MAWIQRKTRRILGYVLAGLAIIVTLAWFFWGRHRITPVGATYTDAYVEEHRGTVRVEVPETYELATIALALTEGLSISRDTLEKEE